ncbi:MAG: SsrA-binding protein SmpB [Candidatus Latescibacteria bacterium]|nr:SsrA-binding protein SmpB [Candidatus Latescibacterota bacterium]
MKLIAHNRKARHDYDILEKIEAGLVLTGTEVKALRVGKANLKDSFARIEQGHVVLQNMYIGPYDQGNIRNHDPTRLRRLLLHRYQIRRLVGRVSEKGLTLVPLSLYFNDKGIAKVELGLVRGRKTYDKREVVAEREAQREIERALRQSQKEDR